MKVNKNVFFVYSFGIMSDKSELKAELERKKQRLAQIREEKRRKEEEREKKRKEEERKRKEVMCPTFRLYYSPKH